jgi:hypothetical protein
MMTDMRPAAESGRTRITLEVPTRGLLGYRNIFFTDTKVLLPTLARTAGSSLARAPSLHDLLTAIEATP